MDFCFFSDIIYVHGFQEFKSLELILRICMLYSIKKKLNSASNIKTSNFLDLLAFVLCFVA